MTQINLKDTWLTPWLLSLFWCIPAFADEAATLSVRGEAQLMVAPDQVTLSVGVIATEKSAQQALIKNNRAMKQVIDAIEKLEFNEEDYETRELSVQPQWSARPRNSDSDWRPTIVSYRVSNNIEIVSERLEEVGALIQAVSDAGANQIRDIRFGLKNPRQHRSRAIEQAVAHARADADVAASASGQKITGVKTINLDPATAIELRQEMPPMRARSMVEADAPPPINSGDVAVRASVSIIFYLAE